ncbi:hypothetical protein AGLY_011120 [Aphis glycines]|uniref:Uncharacterized protein n=1 Tax=Aphis glycines TaxID=307491 RepID=A0A6G0TD55_APHGL|nr:hypothetical protein AGLY_011120 [Aphis glycines]
MIIFIIIIYFVPVAYCLIPILYIYICRFYLVFCSFVCLKFYPLIKRTYVHWRNVRNIFYNFITGCINTVFYNMYSENGSRPIYIFILRFGFLYYYVVNLCDLQHGEIVRESVFHPSAIHNNNNIITISLFTNVFLNRRTICSKNTALVNYYSLPLPTRDSLSILSIDTWPHLKNKKKPSSLLL